MPRREAATASRPIVQKPEEYLLDADDGQCTSDDQRMLREGDGADPDIG
jgi:hypothetical protein